MLRQARFRLPASCVSLCVPAVLSRLGLACCQGVMPGLGLSAMLAFRETLCSLVLRKVHGGIGSSTVEDSGVVVHYVPVEAWPGS